jgi:hypothetical protein
MRNDEARLVTQHRGGMIEIEWVVPYLWSTPVPATRIDPPEGGLEIDGDPWIAEITFYGNLSDDTLTFGGCEPGCLLDLTFGVQYAPQLHEMLDVAAEHNATQLEDTRW